MKYNLIEKRDKIIKEVWENKKAELTMEELAGVFNMPLPSFYRIVKAGQSKLEKPREN